MPFWTGGGQGETVPPLPKRRLPVAGGRRGFSGREGESLSKRGRGKGIYDGVGKKRGRAGSDERIRLTISQKETLIEGGNREKTSLFFAHGKVPMCSMGGSQRHARQIRV